MAVRENTLKTIGSGANDILRLSVVTQSKELITSQAQTTNSLTQLQLFN